MGLTDSGLTMAGDSQGMQVGNLDCGFDCALEHVEQDHGAVLVPEREEQAAEFSLVIKGYFDFVTWFEEFFFDCFEIYAALPVFHGLQAGYNPVWQDRKSITKTNGSGCSAGGTYGRPVFLFRGGMKKEVAGEEGPADLFYFSGMFSGLNGVGEIGRGSLSETNSRELCLLL